MLNIVLHGKVKTMDSIKELDNRLYALKLSMDNLVASIDRLSKLIVQKNEK